MRRRRIQYIAALLTIVGLAVFTAALLQNGRGVSRAEHINYAAREFHFDPTGGVLSSYTVGFFDLDLNDDGVRDTTNAIQLINPTSVEHLIVAVTLWDTNERIRNCAVVQLTQNDLAEVVIPDEMDAGVNSGSIKIVTWNPVFQQITHDPPSWKKWRGTQGAGVVAVQKQFIDEVGQEMAASLWPVPERELSAGTLGEVVRVCSDPRFIVSVDGVVPAPVLPGEAPFPYVEQGTVLSQGGAHVYRPDTGGFLSPYLVGYFSPVDVGDPLGFNDRLYMVNPTDEWLLAAVVLFDDRENPLACYVRRLSPNDYDQINFARAIPDKTALAGRRPLTLEELAGILDTTGVKKIVTWQWRRLGDGDVRGPLWAGIAAWEKETFQGAWSEDRLWPVPLDALLADLRAPGNQRGTGVPGPAVNVPNGEADEYTKLVQFCDSALPPSYVGEPAR